jgi:subtilisin family serine protease
MIRRICFRAATSALFAFVSAILCSASTFTPLEWQQVVQTHQIKELIGQRKHTTWIRDKNRNFIDDEIEKRFHSGQSVDVIVDLNTCINEDELKSVLGKFGQIRYVGKTISFVMLDRVAFDDLPKLALLTQVAMIEWNAPAKLMNDVATRSVQARSSNTYSPNTAEDHGYTGTGVNIAIIDTGVDTTHEAFKGKFVAGFDATNPADPGDGSTNPGDAVGHGTHVAGIALGKETPGRVCRTPDDGSPTNCGGVASGAGLIVVKVCVPPGVCTAIQQGLDWVSTHASAFNIRAANMSFGNCLDTDGTDAESQQVNYMVAVGVLASVAHGNSGNCGLPPGSQITMSPAAASFAITVNASDDQATVTRTDDTISLNFYLTGPRSDFNLMTPDLQALKPDITAPGGRYEPSGGTDNPLYDIWSACAASAASSYTQCAGASTTEYHPDSGTSMATPMVTGAAADVIQATPTIDPGSLKDLLIRTADSSRNSTQGGPTYAMVDPVWNNAFGHGILNVWNAVSTGAATDIGFPSCVPGPPATPGGICPLAPPQPAYENSIDITTATSPTTGVANVVTARVHNFGAVPATVIVNFGVYEFAVGNNQFFHLGSVQVTVQPGATVPVTQPWTPAAPSHQCIQVSIQYGLDTNYNNNVTQRNFSVAASVFNVRVENPYMVPAKIELVTRSTNEKWQCKAADQSFVLQPFGCPRMVRVEFMAPRGTREGSSEKCMMDAYATPQGSDKRQLIGGVTMQTVVPAPCHFSAEVLNATGSPLVGAHVTFTMDDPEVPTAEAPKPVELVAGAGGTVAAMLYPYRTYRVVGGWWWWWTTRIARTRAT